MNGLYRTSFLLNFGSRTNKYFQLLSEEDFDFKTKNIGIDILKNDKNTVKVELSCDSLIELKIATTAVIKSLEIIEKTLNI